MAATVPVVQLGSEGGRAWDANIRAFFGYNTNYPIRADKTYYTGDHDAFYMGTEAQAEYRFVQNRSWTIGTLFRFEGLAYDGDSSTPGPSTSDPNDYDMIVLEPGLFAIRNFDLFGIPASTGLRYDFRNESADHIEAIGLDAHRVTTHLSLRPSPRLLFTLSYEHAWEDFEVSFLKIPLSDPVGSRDAEVDRIRLSGKYYFTPTRSIDLTYVYIDNDATGSNWRYDGHGIGSRFESQITGPLWGALQFDYFHSDYGPPFMPGFPFASGAPASDGRTEQDNYAFLAQLIFVLSPMATVDLYYGYTAEDGGIADFKSDGSAFGMGMTYRF